jgi:hypothetical protein
MDSLIYNSIYNPTTFFSLGYIIRRYHKTHKKSYKKKATHSNNRATLLTIYIQQSLKPSLFNQIIYATNKNVIHLETHNTFISHAC